jgi:hypothetical protein
MDLLHGHEGVQTSTTTAATTKGSVSTLRTRSSGQRKWRTIATGKGTVQGTNVVQIVYK